jgi:hypothetical protein
VKVAVFSVRADVRQAARWKQVCEVEGFRSVGQWAAQALDRYIEHRASVGKPLPLAWRLGRFRVRLEDGFEVEVNGWLALPFGHFRGGPDGPRHHGTHQHTLVYVPQARPIGTFRYARYCRSLASDLVPALLKGELPEPAPILDRHRRESF